MASNNEKFDLGTQIPHKRRRSGNATESHSKVSQRTTQIITSYYTFETSKLLIHAAGTMVITGRDRLIILKRLLN